MSRYDIASEPTEAQVAANYRNVMECIQQAAGGREVVLTAASKTKSPACLKMLYDCGHRHFGENYVQELVEKAAQMPKDVCWHFIGSLQSNKVKELLQGAESLCVVETVDREKIATLLNSGCESYRSGSPLDVFIQVNTSGEESKSGTEPGQATVDLAKFVHTSCPNLVLRGLMTIGMPDYTSRPENFECLCACRLQVAEAIGVPEESLALSMGMSGDFENAIRMGSTNVRVGSSLFGKRFYPPNPMSSDDKGDVLLILDLRYNDLELFESSRAAFVSAVDEMLSLHNAAEVLGSGAVGRVNVFAAGASGVLPVSCDTASDALRGLLSLAPVRHPPRDSDHCVISALQDMFVSAERRRSLLFMTTFTAIGDFFRLAEASRLLSVSFMESAWVSLHVDATALATTSLSLTPSVRAVRSPAAPARVRGSLQFALAPALRLLPRVPVSLRIGRYSIPCVAQRPFLRLPPRCCAAEDLCGEKDFPGEEDSCAELVLGARVAGTSPYERERSATRVATLRAEGIVSVSAVGEDELYGDGWALLPREADGGDGRAPADWLRHLAELLRGDALVLATRQPLLDPPHQLALPQATLVAFALAPGQLYVRAVVPPELRAERPDAETGGPARRLDAAAAEELAEAAKELREAGAAALGQHAGVARMTAQLRRSDRYDIHLEKRQAPQAKRTFHQSLHGKRF